MIKVNTNSRSVPLAQGAQMTKEIVRGVLRSTAVAAERKWSNLASRHLNSSREAYKRGMQRYALSDKESESFVLELTGTFPNMVEHGWSATDLRDTLLKPGQRGVRRSKDGHLYRYVPFRHTAPGSGSTTGAPMGSAYSGVAGVDAPKLGKQIYAAAKRLKPGTALPEGLAPKLRSHHTTDIYAGMRRVGAKGHSHYMTWRTISTAVRRGWQHPGIQPPRQLMEEVRKFVDRTLPVAFGAALDATLPRGQN